MVSNVLGFLCVPSVTIIHQGSMCCFQVHGMWLPHWLAARVGRCQVRWNPASN